MMLSVNQPCYLPWCGFFERVDRADLHVHLDDAQFTKGNKGSFFARNRILDANGREIMLTVPTRAGSGDAFNEVAFADARWRTKHWTSLSQTYPQHALDDPQWNGLARIYQTEFADLAELNMSLIAWLLDTIGIATRVVRSSQLAIAGRADERLVAICRHFGADAYYSPAGARAYIREEVFAEAGIRLVYQEYTPAAYEQVRGRGFVPYLSVMDALLRHGPARTLEIIRAGAPDRSA